jgi:hypothetical protein
MEHINREAVVAAEKKFEGMSLAEMFDALEAKPTVAAAPAAELVVEAAPVEEHKQGRFRYAVDATAFMQGGNAIFTLVSTRTGTRFTYKISRPKDGDGTFLFVSLLTGPDNWENYKYFGYLRRGVFAWGGSKAKVGHDAPGVKAFAWAWQKLVQGTMPETLEIWHEGKCARCGRKLTVPSSIASGWGPECENRML